MRELGILSPFVTICEQLYGGSTTNYIAPHGKTPHMDINHGTMQGNTLSPCLATSFLEPFLRWLTVCGRGYIPCPSPANPPDLFVEWCKYVQ
jgi:hypothetical protein